MFGQDDGGTWAVARLAHIKSMIRTTHPDRICYRPGVMFTSPDRGTRHMSSWGNPDGVDPDSLAAPTFSHPEFRPPTFSHPEFRPPTFHSRMGEEDVSTSPVRLIRIL